MSRRPVLRLVSATFVPFLLASTAAGQTQSPPGSSVTTANYRLAARWAPYKIRRLVYSTGVTPRWIQGSDRFWYEWEAPEGKRFMVVDPVPGSKRPLFDNDRIAAELTRLTRDPWDGKHLPIRSIKFTSKDTLQFEVESSQDTVIADAEAVRGDSQQNRRQGAASRPPTRKKVWHFRYAVATQTLSEIPNWLAPDNHPAWASVSPDGQTIVFTRRYNLYKMTRAEYQKILDARRGKTGAAADSADWKVVTQETQLTTNGEKDYSWGASDFGETDDEALKAADRRKRADVTWSRDSRRFTAERDDRRKVGDLWVVRSVGNKRPQLETYKYDMPGEANVSQPELGIYDLEAQKMVMVKVAGFKDQHRPLQRAAVHLSGQRRTAPPALALAQFERGLVLASEPGPAQGRRLRSRRGDRRHPGRRRGAAQHLRRAAAAGPAQIG